MIGHEKKPVTARQLFEAEHQHFVTRQSCIAAKQTTPGMK